MDGFDELKPDLMDFYEGKLLDFTKRYPLCPIMVSTRSFNQLYSWTNFDIVKILPLTFAQTSDLVRRLRVDDDIKSGFLRLIESQVGADYGEFVSNPLLCTVMLLTYAHYGRISKHRHEFLDDTFSTLWSRHDDRKEGYERVRYCDYTKSEFARLFSAFSFASYLRGEVEMSEESYVEHMEVAQRLAGLNCNPGEFHKDLTLSTCLAVQEGSYISFFHRSIQEYFAAIFIIGLPDDVIGKILEDVSQKLGTDSVLPLILSIRGDRIEKHWVLPNLSAVQESIDRTSCTTREYSRLVLNPLARDSGISIFLSKIRSLYNFSPSFNEIVQICDAHDYEGKKRWSMIGDYLNVEDDTDSNYAFERDRNNFVKLFSALEEKYRNESQALNILSSYRSI